MIAARITATIADFDAQNAHDPRALAVGDELRPQELVDAERLTAWVQRLAPDASVALQLAARCQHLRRWEIPRRSYPEGRAGYLAWRAALQEVHAEHAASTLRAHGWDEATIDAVCLIVRKQPGTTADHARDRGRMEDALCLAFLEHELEAFARKHDDDAVVRILRKTWRKMSASAQQIALGLPLSPRIAALVARAV